MGGDQQRRHRVHQRRFARADVAGQQGIVASGGQCPDLLVEGAPVQHLQPLQSETSVGFVGAEVELGRFIGKEVGVCCHGGNVALSCGCDKSSVAAAEGTELNSIDINYGVLSCI